MNAVAKITVLVIQNVQMNRVKMGIPGQIRKPIHGQNMTANLIPMKKPSLIPEPKQQIAKKQNPNSVGTAIINCVVSARVQRVIPVNGILGLHAQHVQTVDMKAINVNVQIIPNAM